MEMLITIHGELRWIVAALAIIVIGKFAYGWLTKQKYAPIDRKLLLGFTIAMDITVLLGLINLIGRFGVSQLEHATTMLLALIAAHLTAMWRRSDNSEIKYRNQMLLVLLSLALVFVGVWRLRGGFFGWA